MQTKTSASLLPPQFPVLRVCRLLMTAHRSQTDEMREDSDLVADESEEGLAALPSLRTCTLKDVPGRHCDVQGCLAAGGRCLALGGRCVSNLRRLPACVNCQCVRA